MRKSYKCEYKIGVNSRKKKKYLRPEDAIKEAERLNTMPNLIKKFIAYKCTTCLHFHVGRSNEDTPSDKFEKLRPKEEIVEDKINIYNIAGDFNINLIEVRENDKYCIANGVDAYINKSYIIGSDTIQLGIYDDNELKLISLFHEIGHTQTKNNCSIFEIEKEAWEIGYKLAEKYNIHFSDNAKKWALDQLNTYKQRHDDFDWEIWVGKNKFNY